MGQAISSDRSHTNHDTKERGRRIKITEREPLSLVLLFWPKKVGIGRTYGNKKYVQNFGSKRLMRTNHLGALD
jgi:hypothetical protein